MPDPITFRLEIEAPSYEEANDLSRDGAVDPESMRIARLICEAMEVPLGRITGTGKSTAQYDSGSAIMAVTIQRAIAAARSAGTPEESEALAAMQAVADLREPMEGLFRHHAEHCARLRHIKPAYNDAIAAILKASAIPGAAPWTVAIAGMLWTMELATRGLCRDVPPAPEPTGGR